MNREKMAAMDEQQIRASANRQLRAENAERDRRRLEELEERTANFIDMDAFDSDDDLPMQVSCQRAFNSSKWLSGNGTSFYDNENSISKGILK